MSYAVTLSASILIQDTGVTPPVTVAQDSKSDQLATEDEFLEISVTVPASAVDQLLDLATPGLNARSVYVSTTQPVTMKQGSSSFAQPVRSLFMGTYDISNSPASLKFSNPGASAAQVKVVLGSKNT